MCQRGVAEAQLRRVPTGAEEALDSMVWQQRFILAPKLHATVCAFLCCILQTRAGLFVFGGWVRGEDTFFPDVDVAVWFLTWGPLPPDCVSWRKWSQGFHPRLHPALAPRCEHPEL